MLNYGDKVELKDNQLEGVREGDRRILRMPASTYVAVGIRGLHSDHVVLRNPVDGTLWEVAEGNIQAVTQLVAPGHYASHKTTPDRKTINENLEEMKLAWGLSDAEVAAIESGETPKSQTPTLEDALTVLSRLRSRLAENRPRGVFSIDTRNLQVTEMPNPCSDRDALDRVIAELKTVRDENVNLQKQHDIDRVARLKAEGELKEIISSLTRSQSNTTTIEWENGRQDVYGNPSGTLLWSGQPGFNAQRCAEMHDEIKRQTRRMDEKDVQIKLHLAEVSRLSEELAKSDAQLITLNKCCELRDGVLGLLRVMKLVCSDDIGERIAGCRALPGELTRVRTIVGV